MGEWRASGEWGSDNGWRDSSNDVMVDGVYNFGKRRGGRGGEREVQLIGLGRVSAVVLRVSKEQPSDGGGLAW